MVMLDVHRLARVLPAFSHFRPGSILAAGWVLTFRCQVGAQRCPAVNRKLCDIFIHWLALTCLSVK